MNDGKQDRTYWLDQPANVKKIVWGLAAVCLFLLAMDFTVHRHAYFSWEGIYGFYPLFGFIAGVVVVLGAKELRKLIKRDEDYYDR